MKWYQSPLFITAVLFVIYGAYLMTDWGSGPMGWGYLAGVVIFSAGLFAALIHIIIKASIKNKRIHFITELSMIGLFLLWLLFNS